jgi:hypothetical protein
MEDGLTNADEGYKPDLPALKRMYEESQTLTYDARIQEQKDGDYYDGYQLTREEKRILRGRKQPDNTWNFTRLAVNGTLGVIKQGSTDPRAYPRNPQDEDSADVASKTLQYIADTASFDSTKIDFAKDYLVPGTGAVIVGVDDDLKVTVEPIRREEFFYDPRSRRQDFSDARFMGMAKWQWAADVKAEYPGKATEIDGCFGGSDFLTDDLTEDRPRDGTKAVAWVHKREMRLMVVEIYYREGKTWRRCKFTAGVDLESGESPYLNDKKQPICPIEAQSCYVDRENNRMGIVRDMRGPQDEINKRSAKLLHLLNTRQIQESAPGAGMGDADTARKEAARPDGVLPSGWQVVPQADVVSGQALLLQNAHQAMSRFSPNPAILGREGENQSGRANQVRQQAGMTEQAIIFGGIEEWELRVYRQMWNRARQYWTAPMFIRVTDDEGAPDFIGINQPPSLEGPDGQPQPLEAMPDPNGQPDEQGQVPQLMVQGKPAFQGPDGQPVLGYENSLAELDVDITLDTTPDVANLQAEQFALMTELAKMYGPQEIPFEDLLEVSTMPNKRKVIEKRKARAEQAQEGQEQSPQMQMQMQAAMTELAKLQAEVAKLQAETELTRAKTQTEAVRPELEAAKLEHQERAAETDAHFRGAEMERGDLQHDTDTQFRAAEMQRGDEQRDTDAAFRQAEMEQGDRQFSEGQAAQERLAAMKPPPGQ